MTKCAACGRFSSTSEGAKCTKCVCFYHRACVNIPLEAKVSPSWMCPGCKAKTPKKDNTESAVRNETADYTRPQETHSETVSTNSPMMSQLKVMYDEIISFRGDFNAMRDELSQLRAYVSNISGRLDSVEARLSSIENRSDDLNRNDTQELLSTIEQLKAEIKERDQDTLIGDIEITGLPEEKGENITQFVHLIAKKIGITCEDRDLVLVERSGMRRAPSAGDGAGAARARAVVVRLATTRLRDEFLRQARVRRTLTSEGLGLPGEPARIYINERLTRHNKILFYKVREESRRRGWRYAWTRAGRIFVRRESGTAAFRVRTESDLEKVFGGVGDGSRPNRM